LFKFVYSKYFGGFVGGEDALSVTTAGTVRTVPVRDEPIGEQKVALICCAVPVLALLCIDQTGDGCVSKQQAAFSRKSIVFLF
jgi:hypothetical protein